MTATAARLFEGAEWDFAKLQRIHDACEEIARSELGLDTYPNQIEVITAEQMLDAYSRKWRRRWASIDGARPHRAVRAVREGDRSDCRVARF
jgi:hypothetical protein